VAGWGKENLLQESCTKRGKVLLREAKGGSPKDAPAPGRPTKEKKAPGLRKNCEREKIKKEELVRKRTHSFVNMGGRKRSPNYHEEAPNPRKKTWQADAGKTEKQVSKETYSMKGKKTLPCQEKKGLSNIVWGNRSQVRARSFLRKGAHAKCKERLRKKGRGKVAAFVDRACVAIKTSRTRGKNARIKKRNFIKKLPCRVTK